ncbi:type II toxin-antitoxin system ParD family antitoxin [Kribbia dieselivorans]|uniref:type II toxin-antitoxin system ParD family antitoxin n=1 Tax=Kribbia dieselivorans TaxID=331526 RepID=UPI0009F97F02|nr:type II toxin-antitoxin system ParD family antitoxin [Kribbia dieselivorans]
MAESTSIHPDTPETPMATLRAALSEGEISGPAEPFDFDAFIASKRSSGKP